MSEKTVKQVLTRMERDLATLVNMHNDNGSYEAAELTVIALRAVSAANGHENTLREDAFIERPLMDWQEEDT